MRFRILETDNGESFIIQYKRKFWIWENAKQYGNTIKHELKITTGPCFYYKYNTYSGVKNAFDRLIEYALAYNKRKKSKNIVRDEINLGDKKDKFLVSL